MHTHLLRLRGDSFLSLSRFESPLVGEFDRDLLPRERLRDGERRLPGDRERRLSGERERRLPGERERRLPGERERRLWGDDERRSGERERPGERETERFFSYFRCKL
jgi:hypothetical protein